MATPTLVLLNYTDLADADTLTNWGGGGLVDTLDADIKKEGDYSVTGAWRNDGGEDYYTAASAPVTAVGKTVRLWLNTINLPYMDTEANGGYELSVWDGTTYEYLTLFGSDTYPGGWFNIVVDMDLFTTLTLANVRQWGLRIQHIASARNIDNLWLDALKYLDGYSIVGGTAIDPVTPNDIAIADGGTTTLYGYGILGKVSGIFFCTGHLQLGSGATAAYNTIDGEIIVFEDKPIAAGLYKISGVGTGSNPVIKNSVIISAGTTDNTRFILDFDDADLASLTFQDTQIVRASYIYHKSGQIPTGNIYNDCFQIDPKAVAYTDCTVKNGPAASGAMKRVGTSDTWNVKRTKFQDNPVALEVDTAQTLALDGDTFIDNTIDIRNSAVAVSVDTYADTNKDTEIQLNGTNNAVAQSFTATAGDLTRARFWLEGTGSPTGNILAKLYATSAGVPTGAALATSVAVLASSIPTTYAALTEFEFLDEFTLIASTVYAIVIEYASGDGTNHIDVGVDNSTPSHGGTGSLYTTSWASQTWDAIFQVIRDGKLVINASNGADPSQSKTDNTGSVPGVTIINNPITHKLTGMIENSEVTYVKLPTASDTGTDGTTAVGSRNFVTTNAWTVDEHKGRLLIIETGADAGRYYIVSNTATTLKLDAELTAAASSIEYSIYGAMEVVTNTENVPSNGENSYAYTYNGDSYVDIIVFHVDYEDVVLIDILLGSTSQTIPIGQSVDVNYFNPS